MSEPKAQSTGGKTGHLVPVMILLFAGLAARLFVATITAAPAPDSMRYFASAQAFDELSIPEAIRAIDSHPLYPWVLHVLRNTFRAVTGLDGPYIWWRLAQALSIVAALCQIGVAYWVGVKLWNPRVAFWGTLTFCFLPRPVAYGCDAISDSLHGALWLSSLAILISGWRSPGIAQFLASGLLAGLAYMTHLQALILPAAYGAALVLGQILPSWRLPWRSCLRGAMAFGVGYAASAGVFMEIRGGLSPRLASQAILGKAAIADAVAPRTLHAVGSPGNPIIGQPQTPPAAVLKSPEEIAPVRIASGPVQPVAPGVSFARALWILVDEFQRETRLWLLIFAVVVLVGQRWVIRTPEQGLAAIVFCGVCVLLILLRMKAGYLGGRYFLHVLPIACQFAVLGMILVHRYVQEMPPLAWETGWSEVVRQKRRQWTTYGLIALAGFIACGPILIRPVHKDARGYMEAARWLAERAQPQDLVFDPAGYSSFFANRSSWLPSERNPQAIQARFAVVDPQFAYCGSEPTKRAIAEIEKTGTLRGAFTRRIDSSQIGVYLFELDPSIRGQARR